MFTRNVAEAHASEVHSVFAEFRVKQEQFHVENGAYQSLSADETDSCCGATKDDYGSVADAVTTWGAPWTALRMELSQTELKCNYVVIAGVAGDSTGIGTIGGQILPDPPATNWWYGIAECPGNGKTYVTKHDENKTIEYK